MKKLELTHEEVAKIQRDRRLARQPKVIFVKRSPLKKVSKKQATENAAMSKLAAELQQKCGNKSELSGQFSPHLDPHHLAGRGKNLLNPFYIILITRLEHLVEQKHMSFAHKEELRAKVRVIRLAQGYREEDYK